MNTYKAIFQANSVLNRIPAAQTLFGAFCTIIKELDGQEALEEYLQSFEETPWFVHSDMLPEGLFPMPRKSIFSLELVNADVRNRKPEEKLAVLAQYKKYKKLKYISEKIAKKYIYTNSMDELRKDLLEHAEKFEIRDNWLQMADEKINSRIVSRQIVRNSTREGETEKDLFYTDCLYCSKGQRFSLYVKTDLPEQQLERYFKMLQFFGIGSKRTVGMNIFEFLEMVPVKSESPNGYLLSACAPLQKPDIDHSSYEITSNVFRGSYSYNGGYMTGRFSLFACGSLLIFDQPQEYYGSLIRTESQNKEICHYAVGFVL